MDSAFRNLASAAAAIAARAPNLTPEVAIILGSGLGGVADVVDNPRTILYEDLPGFPRPGVKGHAGKLILGKISGVPVAVLQGRVHMYEGHGFGPLRHMIRVLKMAGAGTLFLTCAAGSIRKEIPTGRVMAISDHINMMGMNPLVGPNDDDFGPRFPGMDEAWSPHLRGLLHRAAERAGVDLAEGVYAALLGPSFETPAEIRMLRTIGADAVGMSTVPECIIARHCGMEVVGCCAITNLASGLSDEKLSHDHTLAGAKKAAADMQSVITGFMAEYGGP